MPTLNNPATSSPFHRVGEGVWGWGLNLSSTGLNWYDYGARMYDPQLGRWHVVDPLAENMPGINPFHYCYNNPIRYLDPTGLQGEMFQQDMWSRDRFDSFTGRYIPPMARPGGLTAEGYGDLSSGRFESTYKTYMGYNYLSEDKGNIDRYYFWSYTVYKGERFVWEPTEQRQYGNPNTNRIYSLNNLFLSGSGALSNAIVTKQIPQVLELEWSLIQRANINALSRSITRFGIGASVASGILSSIRYSQIKNPTWGNKTELVVGITGSVLSVIPPTTYIGIGIGVIDTLGGFNDLYSLMDFNEQLYNSSGFILAPIGTPPNLIPIKLRR